MNVSLATLTLILTVLTVLYFLPAIVADRRRHPQATAIFVLNLLLGLTVLGWVGALVWACMNCQPVVPYEAYTFAANPNDEDALPFAQAASARRHGRVPAALSPAQRRALMADTPFQ